MYDALLPKRTRKLYRRSRHKARIDALGSVLVGRGYSTPTVSRYVREWVHLAAEFEDIVELPSSADGAVRDYLDRRLSGGGVRRDVVRAAEVFLDERELDVVRVRPQRSTMPQLYEDIVPPYLAYVTRHRGRRTTHQLEDVLAKFFTWLEERDGLALDRAGARDVREFLRSFPGLHRTTIATYCSALRGFLRYAFVEGLVGSDLSAAVEIPSGYRLSDPPDVLEATVVERLLGAVDRSTRLGKRDYAMLLLAARCGLRPSDIRKLRFDEVDWRERTLALVQSKSQRSLILPLPEDVSAALVDYIRHRPSCAARTIFVRDVAPIQPLATKNNLWPVVARAVRAAGLELGTKQRGMYLLRHSLATRMLARGVAFETIKDVLGHVSADTTRKYSQVDLGSLREVALLEGEVRR